MRMRSTIRLRYLITLDVKLRYYSNRYVKISDRAFSETVYKVLSLNLK